MPRVREWFDDFAAALVERSGRTDWAEPGSEYWEDFEKGLVRIGATWPHADEAASIVCDVPNLFPNNYRPLIVEAIRKLQARQQAEGRGSESGSIEEARLASKGCPRCGGSGLVSARAHAPGAFRTAGGAEMPAGATFGATCPCPMGEAIQRADAALPVDRRSRIPRASDLPMACLPLPAEESDSPPTRGDALAWLRSLVESSRMPQDGPSRRVMTRETLAAARLPGGRLDPVIDAALQPAHPDLGPGPAEVPEDIPDLWI